MGDFRKVDVGNWQQARSVQMPQATMANRSVSSVDDVYIPPSKSGCENTAAPTACRTMKTGVYAGGVAITAGLLGGIGLSFAGYEALAASAALLGMGVGVLIVVAALGVSAWMAN